MENKKDIFLSLTNYEWAMAWKRHKVLVRLLGFSVHKPMGDCDCVKAIKEQRDNG